MSIVVILWIFICSFSKSAAANELWDERFFHYLAVVNASTNQTSCMCETNHAYALVPCTSTFGAHTNHYCHFYIIRRAKFNIAPNQASEYQSETVAMIFNRASLSAIQAVRASSGNHRPLILEPGNATCVMKQIFVIKTRASTKIDATTTDSNRVTSIFLMMKASCQETTTRESYCVYDPWANRFDVVDNFLLPSSSNNAIYLIESDEAWTEDL